MHIYIYRFIHLFILCGHTCTHTLMQNAYIYIYIYLCTRVSACMCSHFGLDIFGYTFLHFCTLCLCVYVILYMYMFMLMYLVLLCVCIYIYIGTFLYTPIPHMIRSDPPSPQFPKIEQLRPHNPHLYQDIWMCCGWCAWSMLTAVNYAKPSAEIMNPKCLKWQDAGRHHTYPKHPKSTQLCPRRFTDALVASVCRMLLNLAAYWEHDFGYL